MGNQQSTATAVSNIITNSSTNVLMESSQKCGQTNTAQQSILFNNIHGGNCTLNFSGISQESVQTPNFMCNNSSSSQSEMQSMFATALKQAAKAETSGLSGALNSSSNSESIANVINNLSTNVHMSTVSECVQNNLSTQSQIYQNITDACPAACGQPIDILQATPTQIKAFDELCSFTFANIGQKMLQGAVSNCLAKNANVQEAITKMETVVAQESTSTNSGINIAASAGGGLLSLFILSSIGASIFM